MRWGLLALLVAVASTGATASVGCAKRADCDAIVDHVADLTLKDMTARLQQTGGALGPDQIEAMKKSAYDGIRADILTKCRDDRWTKKDEACIQSATTLADVGKCEVPK